MSDDALTEMRMVVAVIQPFKLDPVTLALEQIPGFGGMTVSECRGFGHGKIREEESTGEGDQERALRRRAADRGLVDFTSKVKLEIAVAGRERAEAVIETIARTAHTGRPGDGKIFSWPIARVVRVRTRAMDAGVVEPH